MIQLIDIDCVVNNGLHGLGGYIGRLVDPGRYDYKINQTYSYNHREDGGVHREYTSNDSRVFDYSILRNESMLMG